MLRSLLFVLAACLAQGSSGQPPAAGPGDLLVSSNADSKVLLIDTATGKSVAEIPVESGPHEIAVSRDRGRAFVANSGGGAGKPTGKSVTVIDIATRLALAHLNLAPHDRPHDVRVSRDGRTVWAACARTNAVVEVDAASGASKRTWTTGAEGGWFVAVTPDDRRIYVPHLEGRRVTSIDREKGTVRAVVEGGAQSGIDISPDGREVWVVGHEQRLIHVIDSATDTVIAKVPLTVPDFGRLRFTPDGALILLVQERRLAILDTRTRKEVAVVDMPLAGKVMDISPDGRRAAISNPDDHQVTIVDLQAARVVKSFPAGRTPDGVAWVR